MAVKLKKCDGSFYTVKMAKIFHSVKMINHIFLSKRLILKKLFFFFAERHRKTQLTLMGFSVTGLNRSKAILGNGGGGRGSGLRLRSGVLWQRVSFLLRIVQF